MAITYLLAISLIVIVSTTFLPSPAYASSKPTSVKALQRIILASEIQKTLPAKTTPSLVTLSGQDTEVTTTGPLTPQRCLDYSPSLTSVPICSLGDASSTKTMVLLGDSQARMWSEAFNLLASMEHERLVILAKDGCPPWQTTFLTTGFGPYPQCTDFHNFSLAEIRKLHPSQVYVTGGVGELGNVSADLTGATKLLKSLRAISRDTTVLSNIPWPIINPVTCLSAHTSNIGGCNLPYGEFKTAEAQFRKTLQKAAEASGANFADLDSLFCTRTVCPLVVDHVIVYADDSHITWQYSAFVAVALSQILEPTFKS